MLTPLHTLLVGVTLQLDGQGNTLLVNVHSTVLTPHSLMLQAPQKIMANFTPSRTLVGVHLCIIIRSYRN